MATATLSGYTSDKGGYIRQTDLLNATSSGQVSFGGLGSGTDMNEVVDKLVAIESIQKNRLGNWKTTWQAKIDNMTGLSQRLLAIQQGANDLRNINKFMVKQGYSSSSGVATIQSLRDDVLMGSHSLTVGGGDSNPIKHIMRSVGVASPDTNVSPSAATTALSLEINGKTYDIDIPANATLNDIVSAINNDSDVQADGAVVAKIENDGTGSNAYHLTLSSGSGGSAGKINVLRNPTGLSFDTKNMALNTNMLGAGTVNVSLGGTFVGDKSKGAYATYEFTTKNVQGGGVIGADAFKLEVGVTWYNSDGTVKSTGNLADITVPANYVPGQGIEVENGLSLQLGSGVLIDGQKLTINAFANNIDEAEKLTWNGPAITTSGNYKGSVNKTYNFVVADGGMVEGQIVRKISWTDSSGKTGVLMVKNQNEPYEVEKGVFVSFDDSKALVKGDRFSLNVFAPDLQQAQDKGLAQAAKVSHSGFTDYDITPITATDAVFSYTYGGKTVEVDVTKGYTLSQLVRAINEDDDNPGVAASLVNDGLGLPNSWKLVLSGKSTGAEYQITDINHNFTGSSFSNGGEIGGGFSINQRATNSMIKVDGYPTGEEYLQRPYNTISDAIDGVSFSITESGTTTITISSDNQGIYDQIEAFINAINLCQTYIKDSTMFEAAADSDEGIDSAGILIGNYGYYMIEQALNELLVKPPEGPGSEAPYRVLENIGIESDPDNKGAWTIDSSKLKAAIAADPDGVAKLFIQTPPNETDKNNMTNYGVGARAYDKMAELTAGPTTYKDPATGQEKTTAGGPLNVLISNYNDIIANIDKRILREEARITLYEKRMKLRFARMETRLSELNGQADRLTAAIDQLPNNKK